MTVEKIKEYYDNIVRTNQLERLLVQEQIRKAKEQLNYSGIEETSEYYKDTLAVIYLVGVGKLLWYTGRDKGFEGVYQYYYGLMDTLGYSDLVMVSVVHILTESKDTSSLWGYEKAVILFVEEIIRLRYN